MPDKHRIVHIMKIKGVSGAENHLLKLLPGLTDQFDILLIMLVEKRNSMADFAMEFKRKGVKVSQITINNHYDLSVIFKLLRIIRHYKPIIVHTHLIHADLYGLIAGRLANKKIIVSSKHGYDNYERTSLLYRINGLLSGKLDEVITISNALQAKVESAEGIPRSKMRTIHYGLDADEYSSEQDRDFVKSFLGIKDDLFLIGTVGRLIPVKGYETLIKAVSEIDQDFRLLIMGDGPLRKSLEDMVSGLGIDHKILFLGFSPQVSKILSGVDLFVFPTLGEGFGLVLLEAMAHGLPVIASNTMAIPEIVEHEKTGILVPPKDAASLRRAIQRLIASPDERLRMGEMGRKRLREEFSVEKMISLTKSLYGKILESAWHKGIHYHNNL